MRRENESGSLAATARQAPGWIMATALALALVAAAWVLPNLPRVGPVDRYVAPVLQRENQEVSQSPAEQPIEVPHRGMSLTEIRTLPGIATGPAVLAAARREGIEPEWDLSPAEYVFLGRWLAVDDLLSDLTEQYGLDYIWTTLALLSESALDPLAQGPQADDRGLGQVGYWAEDAAQRWGLDPSGPYFDSRMDPQASVWEPEKNLRLASIILRWIYSDESVNRPDEAYAVYTFGGQAVGPSGAIHPTAQARLDRANSYLPMVRNFVAMKTATERPEELAALFAVDRTCVDGMDCYEKIRDYHLEVVRETDNAWLAVLVARECLVVSDLLSQQYGLNQSSAYAALHRELEAWAAIGGADALGQEYTDLIGEVRRRIE